jgi:metal-sulfur cluster biosynthetic enzyme
MVNTTMKWKPDDLTSINCPVAESLPREVEDKVKSIASVKDAEVEITLIRLSKRSGARKRTAIPGQLSCHGSNKHPN